MFSCCMQLYVADERETIFKIKKKFTDVKKFHRLSDLPTSIIS